MTIDPQHRDNIARWLPTIVALFGIFGSIYYLGERVGRNEQALINLAERGSYIDKRVDSMVPRAEYTEHLNTVVVQFNDMKQSLRDANNKLDRLIERQP